MTGHCLIAQPVSEEQVPTLPGTSDTADVDVHAESWRPQHSMSGFPDTEGVAGVLQRRSVGRFVLRVRDADLDVDYRLCHETGNRGGADVFHPLRLAVECAEDPILVFLEMVGHCGS